jgi:hypothetical protein
MKNSVIASYSPYNICNVFEPSKEALQELGKGRFTHSMPRPCHSHTVPCRAAEGLECVFPIWFTQCGRVWFTLEMPCPCHALTMPLFSRPRHSTAVWRRPVGFLPAFGFFRLPRGVPRSLLSEAYHFPSQLSIPTTVKSGSSTLEKRLVVRVFPATMQTFTKDTALLEQGRSAAWHVWINAQHGRGTAWARHAMCESALIVSYIPYIICEVFEPSKEALQ